MKKEQLLEIIKKYYPFNVSSSAAEYWGTQEIKALTEVLEAAREVSFYPELIKSLKDLLGRDLEIIGQERIPGCPAFVMTYTPAISKDYEVKIYIVASVIVPLFAYQTVCCEIMPDDVQERYIKEGQLAMEKAQTNREKFDAMLRLENEVNYSRYKPVIEWDVPPNGTGDRMEQIVSIFKRSNFEHFYGKLAEEKVPGVSTNMRSIGEANFRDCLITDHSYRG